MGAGRVHRCCPLGKAIPRAVLLKLAKQMLSGAFFIVRTRMELCIWQKLTLFLNSLRLVLSGGNGRNDDSRESGRSQVGYRFTVRSGQTWLQI